MIFQFSIRNKIKIGQNEQEKIEVTEAKQSTWKKSTKAEKTLCSFKTETNQILRNIIFPRKYQRKRKGSYQINSFILNFFETDGFVASHIWQQRDAVQQWRRWRDERRTREESENSGDTHSMYECWVSQENQGRQWGRRLSLSLNAFIYTVPIPPSPVGSIFRRMFFTPVIISTPSSFILGNHYFHTNLSIFLWIP